MQFAKWHSRFLKCKSIVYEENTLESKAEKAL